VLVERLGWTPELRVRRHDVVLDAAPDSAPALRVAFASDFHAGPYTSHRVLQHAVRAVVAAEPDVLLLGGDYVAVRARYIDRLAGLLAEVPAPAGRFAVLGNHDHYAGSRVIINALERAGIEVLVNRSVRLPPPHEAVRVCGLDDHLTGYPDAAEALDDPAGPASDVGVRLVLMHAPSGLLDLGARPFALALAGHTHGGQIALPGGRPLLVPGGRLSRRYHAGDYELGEGRRLLVSRGVGQSTVPFRWNAPPEVHLLNLCAPGAPKMPERRGA
jgi:predicted MPP superfamily phosphohydrolase